MCSAASTPISSAFLLILNTPHFDSTEKTSPDVTIVQTSTASVPIIWLPSCENEPL